MAKRDETRTANKANKLRRRARVFRDMAPEQKADGAENAYHQAAEGLDRQADAIEIDRAVTAANKGDAHI